MQSSISGKPSSLYLHLLTLKGIHAVTNPKNLDKIFVLQSLA